MILGPAGDSNPSASEARDLGGIIPFRWAASFRNPWAQSSRYRRAASSELAEGKATAASGICYAVSNGGGLR